MRYMAEKKTIQPEFNRGRIFQQWKFPEYEKPDRGILWYIIAIGFGGGLLLFAINDGNFLFALIILLFALILFTHHRQEPTEISFILYETGILIGDRFYLFRQIDSFAIIYEPPMVKVLYIMPRNAVLRKELSIPLGKQNPVQLRALLLDYLEEDLDREEETVSDMATRIFKL